LLNSVYLVSVMTDQDQSCLHRLPSGNGGLLAPVANELHTFAASRLALPA
jgi:hypothetical protein